MRFNLRWLKEYLDTDLAYGELLSNITMAGHEVEESHDLGAGSGLVVVGQILEIERHPNADKLSLCKVQADAEKPLQIVCGATNIAVGQRVPLAKVGATLPNGMTLKPTKIRGVDSEGMMCSAKELGIAEDHSGIWIQADDLKVGESFDAVIEIKVTPNRPDALSLVGLARDLAAKTGGKLRNPEVKFPESNERAEAYAKVVVEAKEDCPRYAARVIKGVKIGSSPLWLQRKLEAAGLRPRNNVVDVTNYVMIEMGHPLHAFDADTIGSRTVVVRRAKAGEKMRLLDDSTVELVDTDLLIADPEKPIALAGIMGGGETEISDSTVNVLLEAAYFRPATIRRTSKRLDKSTDASYRFERGTDPKKLINALHRAAQLIAELAGGEVLKGHIDVVARIPEAEPITLRIERMRMLSGLDLTAREITDILTRLGFEVQRGGETEVVVVAPSHRPDIAGEADLVEEVTRIYGYDRIPAKLPPLRLGERGAAPEVAMSGQLTDEMVNLGFCQAVNFSFTSEGHNAAAGIALDDPRTVRVLNPLQKDQSVMRRSLIPSLLQNLVHNQNHGVEEVRLFEVGKTYAWAGDKDEPVEEKSLTPVTEERRWLVAILSGTIKPDWRTPARDYDFYDIKGVAEELMDRIGLRRTVIEPVTDHGMLHPARSAALLKGGQRLCWFGELHPSVAKELDLRKRAYLLECPIEGALLSEAEALAFRELPRFPANKRDIAVVAKNEVRALDMERTIRAAAKDILAGVRLFDLYDGKGIDPGHRSLAFSLTFRVADRTLTDEEVNAAIGKVLADLEKKHGARQR